MRFSNDYYLTVSLDYAGCTCCADLPEAKMRMTIVPLINPECFNLVRPEDWNPVDFGNIDMVADHTPLIGGNSD